MPGFNDAALVAVTEKGSVSQPLHRFPDFEEALAMWAMMDPHFLVPPVWHIRQPRG